MKLSSSHLLCLMSGILLVLVTSIKAEYEWNGKEWIWKDAPTNSEGSGDYVDSVDEDGYENSNYDSDDEDDYEGSGDDSSYGRQNNNPPPSSNIDNTNLNRNRNNLDGSSKDVQITPAPDMNSYDRFPDENLDRQPEREDPIIVDSPQTTFPSPVENDNNNNIVNRNKNNFGTKSPTSFFAQPGTMAAVIGGAVVGLLCAILCVMFVVYRMRKKDEGSYALDEPKRSPTVNSYSKPPSREFYA